MSTEYTISPKPPGVSIPIFCDVVKVLTKHFGKKTAIPTEQMETVRQVASVLEEIGKAATGRK